MKTSVNVYDFDHTIYDGDASRDFILYCLLRNPRTWKYIPAQGLALVKYAFGLASRKQVKEVAFAYLRELSDVDAEVRSFWNAHMGKIKPWYREQKHPNDLIISASPEFLLMPIAKRLGIEPPIATIMDPHTGAITGENCRAEEKVKRLSALGSSVKVTNCYSDSMSDLPLLKLAVNAYMVKKHKVVKLQHDSIDGLFTQQNRGKK